MGNIIGIVYIKVNILLDLGTIQFFILLIISFAISPEGLKKSPSAA